MMASLLFLALLAFTPTLCAQLSTRATITGTVTDTSGAVVPGANVTITDDLTKVAIKTQTNGSGVFVAPNLNVSTYTVTIAKPGFKNYTVTGIELHPTESVAVNGVLSVGAQTQTVSVEATSTQVETSTPETSAEIDAEQVSSLPMNGRNYMGLATLMPGVQNTSSGSALTTGGRSTQSSLSINGMAVARALYVLDGIWNENTGNMTQTSVVPNPDSIEEVRVLQNNFSAQYSLMGSAVILAQTKSGTANFHSTLWEFFRNDDLNTHNYFSPTILPYKQNIFGYNLGGPLFIPKHYNVDRQKTFFFWSQQFVVLHQASPLFSIVPTPAQISGCFVSPIKDPVAGTNFAAGTGTCPTTSYQIPSARINSSSAAYLSTLYPTPNYSVTGNANNYENVKPAITNQHDEQIKVDHNFSPKYHMFAEYFDEYQMWAQSQLNTSPINTETDFTHNKLAQVSLTQTLTPNMVNTTSISMNIFLLSLTLVGKTDIRDIPGFTETFFYPTAYLSSRIPVVSLSGGTAGQGITAARPLLRAPDLDNTITDNWSWLHGKNYVTAGMQILFNTKRQYSGQQTNGNLSFNGNSTKPSSGSVVQDDAIADMLLGYVGGFSQISNMPHGEMHAMVFSPYVEDQIKFSKNLTFTLGVRVFHMPLPHGVGNSETNWAAGYSNASPYYNPFYVSANAPTVNEYTGITNLVYPNYPAYSNGLLYNSGTSAGLPVNFSKAHKWYVAPDAGFAWDVFGNGKTSLRGGFGLTYTRIFTNQDCSFNCIANPPVLTSQNLSNLLFPSTTTWNITTAGGTGNPIGVESVTAADYNVQASAVDSYSLGIQHEFPLNIIASVVGAGTRIQHLVGTWNYNQPPPTTISSVTYDFNPLLNANPANSNKGDSSAYWEPYLGYNGISTISTRLWQEWNGLEVDVKHPVSKRLFATVAYTWSHNTTNLAGNGVINPYAISRYHGNTENLNFPQSVGITLIYTLPFFEHSKGFEKAVLRGWRFSDITTFRAGTSLSPGLSMSNQGLASRPDMAPGNPSTNGPKTWRTGSTKQWFNTAAFQNPAYGYYGNAQTGIIRGPGQEIYNMAFFKEFRPYRESVIEFRAEAFNAFNHTNPGNPNTTLGNANYGKVTSSLDQRILELALRIKF
jgi:hypothetical protein